MTEERKMDEFEDERKKWKIYFDLEDKGNRGDYNILVIFKINKNHPLTDGDIAKLKRDLKDLGKLRIIKQGKEFLEK